jgi:Superinfection immunity protein
LVLAWFAGADMSGVPGGIVGAVILFALYFLPATVAAWRHHPSVNAITALNLFLGWTLIGWVYALVGPSQVAVTPAPGADGRQPCRIAPKRSGPWRGCAISSGTSWRRWAAGADVVTLPRRDDQYARCT